MAKRVMIGNASDMPTVGLKTFDADGTTVVVAKVGDGFCAIINKCSHLNLPISGGKLEGDAIVCPWHNSKFEMCTGKNLDWVSGVVGVKLPEWSRKIVSLGKEPAPIQSFTVTEEEGKLYVEV